MEKLTSHHQNFEDSSLKVFVSFFSFPVQDGYKIVYLCEQVGEAGPVLDVMAIMMENISTITVISRTMIAAVYRTAQIVASIPNLCYPNKAWAQFLLLSLFFFSRLKLFYLNFFKILIFPLGISWGFVSSITPSHGSSRPWNTNWSSPHLFCCPGAIFSLPSSMSNHAWVKEGLRTSKDDFKNCLCFFFLSCPFWEIKEGKFFLTGKYMSRVQRGWTEQQRYWNPE